MVHRFETFIQRNTGTVKVPQNPSSTRDRNESSGAIGPTAAGGTPEHIMPKRNRNASSGAVLPKGGWASAAPDEARRQSWNPTGDDSEDDDDGGINQFPCVRASGASANMSWSCPTTDAERAQT